MRRMIVLLVAVAAALLLLTPRPLLAAVKEPPSGTAERLEEIFALRARWLLNDEERPIEGDYLTDRRTAKWALAHEKAKIASVRQWAEGRGVRFVEAKPSLKVQFLGGTDAKARFYVAESLTLGYVYPGEEQINRFGVGSRHIVELYQSGDRWAIGMEWYADPLGEEGETPAFAPAMGDKLAAEALGTCNAAGGAVTGDVAAWGAVGTGAVSTGAIGTGAIGTGAVDTDSLARGTGGKSALAKGGYDREKAVQYADRYCGLAAGCQNQNRYNPRYRDYSGEGGNCANFASQALRAGGLRLPTILRADNLIYSLTGSGRGSVAYRGKFSPKWKEALKAGRFPDLVKKGDLVGYHFKGKMAHVAMVTSFDSRGYPMVNSHTADRYHVPFDLGWDKATTFWLVRVW